MRFLQEVLFANMGLKLLAVAASLALWAMYVPQPEMQRAYAVPVAFADMPGNLAIANTVPPTVNVLVRGRAAFLRRITPDELALTVDLRAGRAGETLVRLIPSMATVPRGIEIVNITPAELHVALAAQTPPEAAGR
jgi:hypothetical protein